jgi:hypothetical protein
VGSGAGGIDDDCNQEETVKQNINEDYRKVCMCENKVGHDTRSVAKIALRVLRRKLPNTTAGIYKCPYCRKWHVGKDGKQ